MASTLNARPACAAGGSCRSAARGATLEVCLAMLESAGAGREVQLSHQVAMG
ncbi:MAG: hypothetical protein ABIR98_13015 [Usitatibacter sp.]